MPILPVLDTDHKCVFLIQNRVNVSSSNGRFATLRDIGSSSAAPPGEGSGGGHMNFDDDDDDGHDPDAGENWYAGGERRWLCFACLIGSRHYKISWLVVYPSRIQNVDRVHMSSAIFSEKLMSTFNSG